MSWPAHQLRVLEERRELAERAGKLLPFLQSDTYKALDPAEQRRLKRQANIMAMYADVLEERIEAFGVQP